MLIAGGNSAPRSSTGIFLKLVNYACVLVPLVSITMVLRNTLDSTHILYFLLPNILLGGFLIQQGPISYHCFKNLLALSLSYLLILALYALYFYLNEGLIDLLYGVFIIPMKRSESVHFPPPSAVIIVSAVLFYFSLCFIRGKTLFFASFLYLFFYSIIYVLYDTSSSQVPFALIASLPCFLSLRALTDHSVEADKKFWIPFSTFGLLLHYPFFSYAYIGYTILFSFLATFLYFSSSKGTYRNQSTYQYFLAALLLTGFLSNSIRIDLNNFMIRDPGYEIPVQENQQPPYCVSNQLISLVKEYSNEDEPILAFPDSPEVYYFTERRNPTRYIYNMLSRNAPEYDKLLELPVSANLDITIVNEEPAASPGVKKEHLDILRKIYLHETVIDNYRVFYERGQVRNLND
jgi:hypothetical protein